MMGVLSAGVKFNLLDKILQRIRDYLMFHKVSLFRTRVKEAEAYLPQSNNLLKQAREFGEEEF